MTRWLLAAALALPVAGLAANIAWRGTEGRGATEWRIPVAGYDPRDPVRGHYVAFRYAWTVRGQPQLCRANSCALCLEDGGRAVRVVAKSASCPAKIDLAESRLAATYAPEFGGGGQPLAVFARLFVSEASAPALEAQLRSRPMQVRARLTAAGRLINLALEPAGDPR